jgi:hypothetical protein
MRIISHRANLNGPSEDYSEFKILRALRMGFDIEIDVRGESNKLWVGHDRHEFLLSKNITSNEMLSRVWYHAKDLAAVELLPDNALAFAHADDDFTIVAGDKKIIWLHPRLNPRLDELIATAAITPNRTIVLDVQGHPRLDPFEFIKKRNHFLGVCTDWPIDWLEELAMDLRSNLGVEP